MTLPLRDTRTNDPNVRRTQNETNGYHPITSNELFLRVKNAIDSEFDAGLSWNDKPYFVAIQILLNQPDFGPH